MLIDRKHKFYITKRHLNFKLNPNRKKIFIHESLAETETYIKAYIKDNVDDPTMENGEEFRIQVCYSFLSLNQV